MRRPCSCLLAGLVLAGCSFTQRVTVRPPPGGEGRVYVDGRLIGEGSERFTVEVQRRDDAAYAGSGGAALSLLGMGLAVLLAGYEITNSDSCRSIDDGQNCPYFGRGFGANLIGAGMMVFSGFQAATTLLTFAFHSDSSVRVEIEDEGATSVRASVSPWGEATDLQLGPDGQLVVRQSGWLRRGMSRPDPEKDR